MVTQAFAFHLAWIRHLAENALFEDLIAATKTDKKRKTPLELLIDIDPPWDLKSGLPPLA